MPPQSFFRITLTRSQIGLPHTTRGVLRALGLKRRSQTVFHPVHPQFAGMILQVKELVKVEEVKERLSNREVKGERTPDAGFWVETGAGTRMGRGLEGWVEGEAKAEGEVASR